jgi:hypothetical protein
MSRPNSISVSALSTPAPSQPCLRLPADGPWTCIGRPFDGTDAAVADKDSLKSSCSLPVSLKEASGKTLVIAPAARFNYGYRGKLGSRSEGQFENPLSPSGPAEPQSRRRIPGGVLREGSLPGQDPVPCCNRVRRAVAGQPRETLTRCKPRRYHVSQRWDWGHPT